MKDGWNITHDPLRLKWGGKDHYVDMGAERLLAASKNQRQIAIEIKSFVGHSEMRDLQQAVGQFVLYKAILAQLEPERELYLAVTEEVATSVFDEPIGQLILQDMLIKVLSFEPSRKEIVRWIG